jgi:low affinity Fe/Cu permease
LTKNAAREARIKQENKMNRVFSGAASFIARQAGRPITFVLATLTIVSWAITGPIFNYSDTWQLVINTGTTIVTFLMVFVIQNTQNRDGAALQAKLDELIRSSQAKNQFIGIEHLTDEEIDEYRQSCEALAKKVTERTAERAGEHHPAG